VWHYHPVTFVNFINEKLLEAKLLGDNGVGAFDKADAVSTDQTGVKDDLDDKEGDSFVTEAELKEEVVRDPPSYQDLFDGFND
jgi:hypothetical protein